jgi:hypothetical protein
MIARDDLGAGQKLGVPFRHALWAHLSGGVPCHHSDVWLWRLPHEPGSEEAGHISTCRSEAARRSKCTRIRRTGAAGQALCPD